MKKMLMLASVLAMAGTTSCKKDQPDTTTPATTYQEEAATTPTPAETTTPTEAMPSEGEIEEEVAEGAIEEPSETTLAGRTPMRRAEMMAVQEVVAVFAPMHGGNITGSIRVKETASGLELDANLSALPQGDVSLIVHAHGDCSSADGSSAGEAFDLGMPAAAAKGSLALVRADRSGKATAKETFQGASLHGERSLLGRSVMLHEGAVSASGGLGKPLACAVFGIAREYEHGATK